MKEYIYLKLMLDNILYSLQIILHFNYSSVTYTLSVVAGQEPQYALLGEKTIIKTGIKSPPDEILWKSQGNKVVEFNGNEENSFLKYKGRVGLDYHSADLTISDLRFEDSGQYELEIYTNKKMIQKYYKLEVIGKCFFFVCVICFLKLKFT